jgi:hypothetical protein
MKMHILNQHIISFDILKGFQFISLSLRLETF